MCCCAACAVLGCAALCCLCWAVLLSDLCCPVLSRSCKQVPSLPAGWSGMTYLSGYQSSRLAMWQHLHPNSSIYMQLRIARHHLTNLAKESGQQRFAPADLDSFLASLPDTRTDNDHEAGSVNPQGLGADPSDGSDLEGGAGEALRQMADLSFVPEERRGGVRQKGVSKGTRTMLKGKQRRVSPGQTYVKVLHCSPCHKVSKSGLRPMCLVPCS